LIESGITQTNVQNKENIMMEIKRIKVNKNVMGYIWKIYYCPITQGRAYLNKNNEMSKFNIYDNVILY
jgi:replicative DNA helicase